ncbi:aspartate aminotransferase, cytoplasmic-like [Heterodontus francisci]|uniref:aspartate aminotransferase, cytoplasmic-like n=1 Tax=Heterodontus francisci TaxID=7792 RepID=UPI00355B5EBC
MAALSVFHEIPEIPTSESRLPVPTFRTVQKPDKLDLGIREYCADNGQPWTPPVVRKVQQQIMHDPTLNYDYLPVQGLPEFNRATTALILGKHSIAIVEKRADSIQVPGGNAALSIAAQFLKQWYTICHPKAAAVYVPLPSWEAPMFAFHSAGFQHLFKYRYWDSVNLCFATQQWLEDLENAPEYSIVVLHIAAHWPTAMDPTSAEWRQTAEVMKRKKHFPFFYMTAQGLASGHLGRDAWPVRHFVTERFELFCAQSFSKNFGLYNERVGSLTVVSRDNNTLVRIRSQMELIARCSWSNPPRFGARIVATILNNPAFFAEW